MFLFFFAVLIHSLQENIGCFFQENRHCVERVSLAVPISDAWRKKSRKSATPILSIFNFYSILVCLISLISAHNQINCVGRMIRWKNISRTGKNFSQRETEISDAGTLWGMGGGSDPHPPIFCRSVNPIPTKVDIFCPPKIFHLPASLEMEHKYVKLAEIEI